MESLNTIRTALRTARDHYEQLAAQALDDGDLDAHATYSARARSLGNELDLAVELHDAQLYPDAA